MSTDEQTTVCCDSIDLRIENGWLTEVHNHCTCGGSGILSPAHLPGCGLAAIVPLADIAGLAERDRQVAEQAGERIAQEIKAVALDADARGLGSIAAALHRAAEIARADSAAPAPSAKFGADLAETWRNDTPARPTTDGGEE